jgi:hypothetical protein
MWRVPRVIWVFGRKYFVAAPRRAISLGAPAAPSCYLALLHGESYYRALLAGAPRNPSRGLGTRRGEGPICSSALSSARVSVRAARLSVAYTGCGSRVPERKHTRAPAA